MSTGSVMAALQDATALKQGVKRGAAKRILRFAAPYVGLLAIFLVVVVLDSATHVVQPLIYRQIIDQGILRGNVSLVIRFAALAGLLVL